MHTGYKYAWPKRRGVTDGHWSGACYRQPALYVNVAPPLSLSHSLIFDFGEIQEIPVSVGERKWGRLAERETKWRRRAYNVSEEMTKG